MEIYKLKSLYSQKDIQRSEILDAYREIIAEKGVESVGEELIQWAASENHAEAIKLLIDAGVSPQIIDKYAFTLLHYAARMQFQYNKVSAEAIKETVNLLLDNKVSVLRKDENENMACYHYAARSGNYPFVEALAQRGAKLNFTDKEGNTGIHIAAQYVRHEAGSLKLAQKDIKSQQELAKTDRTAAIALANRLPKINEHKRNVENYFKTIKAFADGGVDIDEKNSYDRSALEIAVESNAKKIGAFLAGYLNDESDEEAIAAGGMTLYQAADKGDAEAIRAIAKMGADVNGICTPKEYNGHTAGYTALAIACNRLSVEAVEALLECGANPSFKNSGGRVAINCCLNPQVGYSAEVFTQYLPNIFKAFAAAGFDINSSVDDDSNTILNLACKTRSSGGYNRWTFKGAVIENALRLNADLNIANRFGETPLMFVCAYDFDNMEKYQLQFLESGADVSAKDQNGDTALHYAAKNDSNNGAKVLCDMLLEFGSDVNAANNEGKTALDIATQKGNEPLVKLLLSKM